MGRWLRDSREWRRTWAKNLEVVHGVKGNPKKTYRRRAKNVPLRKIKRIIKES